MVHAQTCLRRVSKHCFHDLINKVNTELKKKKYSGEGQSPRCIITGPNWGKYSLFELLLRCVHYIFGLTLSFQFTLISAQCVSWPLNHMCQIIIQVYA